MYTMGTFGYNPHPLCTLSVVVRKSSGKNGKITLTDVVICRHVFFLLKAGFPWQVYLWNLEAETRTRCVRKRCELFSSMWCFTARPTARTLLGLNLIIIYKSGEGQSHLKAASATGTLRSFGWGFSQEKLLICSLARLSRLRCFSFSPSLPSARWGSDTFLEFS